MNAPDHSAQRRGASRLGLWLFAFIALLLAALLLPPLPKVKARPSRNQAVNNVASVSLTLPGTNAPPAAATNK
jgi:hypothetical protein